MSLKRQSNSASLASTADVIKKTNLMAVLTVQMVIWMQLNLSVRVSFSLMKPVNFQNPRKFHESVIFSLLWQFRSI